MQLTWKNAALASAMLLVVWAGSLLLRPSIEPAKAQAIQISPPASGTITLDHVTPHHIYVFQYGVFSAWRVSPNGDKITMTDSEILPTEAEGPTGK